MVLGNERESKEVPALYLEVWGSKNHLVKQAVIKEARGMILPLYICFILSAAYVLSWHKFLEGHELPHSRNKQPI